ncbi:MAG: TrkH family potassium uptake protein [Christensenellales bacterium]|jgi:trk system potassium uptake protein TrkH|nr:TrkH family potassium uptake protein [Clostridia bacterium]
MNFRMVFNLIGKILLIVSATLLIPLAIALGLKEYNSALAFLWTVLAMAVPAAALVTFVKPKTKTITVREGFMVVGFSWVLVSVLGALPFLFSRSITNFVDCIFETVSGFTTTGATILTDIEALDKSVLFWRSFTHWLGGMGVLVLALAVLPTSDATVFQLMKWESPGPKLGKMVSKVRFGAQVLYLIYFVMTVLLMILLLIGGMDPFNSAIVALSTAGTGGFAATNASIAAFGSVYVDIVVTVFMYLFSLNFTIYYLFLLKKFKDAVKSTEFKFYTIYLVAAILFISLNIMRLYGNFGTALRYASFQTITVSSTTGFSTADYTKWPAISQAILMLTMFIGACASSTGGGFKVSRLIILLKSVFAEIKRVISPRSVHTVKLDGKPLSEADVRGANTYFVVYVLVFIAAVILVTVDNLGFAVSFSAVLTSISNVGPGLGIIGPSGNFSVFSYFSKLVLSGIMLLGRLEIFPLLMLFSPRTWTRR